MKQLVVCAAALLLSVTPLMAQSKVFDRTVNLAPGGLLKLDATRGSVRLTSWDRDQVEIHARIEADDSWDASYARRAVDATTVDVNTTSIMKSASGVITRMYLANIGSSATTHGSRR